MTTWQLAELPFLEERHRHLAAQVASWCEANRALLQQDGQDDFAGHCRDIVARLAGTGLLDHVLPAIDGDGKARFDLRAICVVREGLAYESNLAASLFVIQGMGLSPLFRFGSAALRDSYIDRARRGETIGAIAVSEMQGASDVASLTTTAIRDGDSFVIHGEKVWIANGGFADHYLVLARSGDAGEKRSISAFLVDASLPGVMAGSDVQMIDHCPLAKVRFDHVRVPASHMIGELGDGMRAAMAGFDVFRPSVGAAAVGLAKRAFAETVTRTKTRDIFGGRMAELDGVQACLADMLADVETGSMAVYRAAWTGDVVSDRYSTEAALAKLVATEAAQRVVDTAVQLFGAAGVSRDCIVERLYRELRPMRIYEGASEIQKKIIARGILREGEKS